MNKIPIPTYDDAGAFSALAANHRVASHPRLQPLVATVQASYLQYAAVRGNPAYVLNPSIHVDLGNFLKGHYASPPGNLSHITELRASTEHLICPMCGSMHRGTLDHYLPKNSYSIFSVFSLNLVPACKCNSKRKETLAGPNPDERVLHPYFDDCLGERLIKAKFDDLGMVPQVTVVLTVPSTHPNYAAIDFHFREIVQKTAIRKYLADQWSNLCRKPSLAVRALERNINDPVELQHKLEEELGWLDEQYRGKNNWNSVFVSGLLDAPVMDWLLQRLSSPHRQPNAALV